MADRIYEEFDRWHGPAHMDGEGSDVDITPACRSAYRAGFERAVELAAKVAHAYSDPGSGGDLMYEDGARACAVHVEKAIRALGASTDTGGKT